MAPGPARADYAQRRRFDCIQHGDDDFILSDGPDRRRPDLAVDKPLRRRIEHGPLLDCKGIDKVDPVLLKIGKALVLVPFELHGTFQR
jgi:hypothetical protein